MGIIKANGRMVWLNCRECGERFGQPYGAVTSTICGPCIKIRAAEFWVIYDQEEARRSQLS